MGRYYQTASPKFVEDIVFTPPWKLLEKVQKLEGKKIEEDISKVKFLSDLEIAVPDYMKDNVDEFLNKRFESRFRDIAKKIQENPEDLSYRNDMNKLQNEFLEELESGKLKKVLESSKNYSNFVRKLNSIKDPESREIYSRYYKIYKDAWDEGRGRFIEFGPTNYVDYVDFMGEFLKSPYYNKIKDEIVIKSNVGDNGEMYYTWSVKNKEMLPRVRQAFRLFMSGNDKVRERMGWEQSLGEQWFPDDEEWQDFIEKDKKDKLHEFTPKSKFMKMYANLRPYAEKVYEKRVGGITNKPSDVLEDEYSLVIPTYESSAKNKTAFNTNKSALKGFMQVAKGLGIGIEEMPIETQRDVLKATSVLSYQLQMEIDKLKKKGNRMTSQEKERLKNLTNLNNAVSSAYTGFSRIDTQVSKAQSKNVGNLNVSNIPGELVIGNDQQVVYAYNSKTKRFEKIQGSDSSINSLQGKLLVVGEPSKLNNVISAYNEAASNDNKLAESINQELDKLRKGEITPEEYTTNVTRIIGQSNIQGLSDNVLRSLVDYTANNSYIMTSATAKDYLEQGTTASRYPTSMKIGDTTITYYETVPTKGVSGVLNLRSLKQSTGDPTDMDRGEVGTMKVDFILLSNNIIKQ